MRQTAVTGLSLALFAATSRSVPTQIRSSVRFSLPDVVETNSLHNVHVTFDESLSGHVSVVFGNCDMVEVSQHHHTISNFDPIGNDKPDRLVWMVPEDVLSVGCLHAFTSDGLVGRSRPVSTTKSISKRYAIADFADALGPWFDGVAYMQEKGLNATASAEAKNKKIAIVGGGMAGLLTSHLLESVGIHNWHITESSQRIGGRIRTKALNGTDFSDYQYQEMGPMRFPVSWKDPETNDTVEIQDHKMVFQLGETLNEMNGHDPNLAVTFIDWIQSSTNTPANSNGFRLENGRAPSRAQLAANSSLSNPPAAAEDPEVAGLAEEAFSGWVNLTSEKKKLISDNVFRAHREAIDQGYFHFSEAAYLRYEQNLDNNMTDFIAGSQDGPVWEYDTVYFGADKWKTIDKGLESLPRAFEPHVREKITYGRKVEGLTYNDTTDKIYVNWRNDPMQMVPESEEYDYAVVAVPFSKVRTWRLPRYSSGLTRAIQTLNYDQSCKVALHYSTRFWEHLEEPILGGCGSSDIYGVGSICYPSYKINSTGPGVLLANYASSTPARSLAALSEEDHVALIQRAMVEIHGEVAAEEYTGNYYRQCWENDEHQAGAWASPLLGQQDTYIPEFFTTQSKTLFAGEHTSYTHAWIFSALDSSVRVTAQLLLDMGLVDEAKTVVQTWMGRWISI